MQDREISQTNNSKTDYPRFFWEAAGTGDIATLNYLLENNLVVNVDITLEGVTPLWLAAQGGYRDIAKLLLNYGADINFRGTQDQTPLWTAAAHGHTEVISLLLEHNALIDKLCNAGCSALWIASQENHIDTVKVLIKYNCDINLPFQTETPLFTASLRGHTPIVEELIKANASLYQLDKEGRSALHGACAKGHIQVVKALIQAGANVNAVTYRGKIPLYYAYGNNQQKVADLLLENGSLPDLSFQRLHAQFLKYLEFYPKLNSIEGIDISAIKKSLNNGLCYGHAKMRRLMKDDSEDKFRNLLSQIATWDGSFEALECNRDLQETFKYTLSTLYLLHISNSLRCNSSIQIKDKRLAEIDSAYEKIFNFGFVFKIIEIEKILQILLQHNVTIEISHLNKAGPHIILLTKKDSEYKIYDSEASVESIKTTSLSELISILILLLDANTNTMGLSIAINVKQPTLEEKRIFQQIKNRFLDLLLAERITKNEIDLKDERGLASLFYAIYAMDNETALKLIANKAAASIGNETFPTIYLAAQIGNHELVLKLINNGSDVNAKCRNDYLLHIATSLGHTKVVKTLLEEKAIVDCVGNSGATPLYIACQNGFIEIAKDLIAGKANVNFSLTNGNTPLYIAISNGHIEVVKLLLNHGANINQKVGSNTPLGLAIINGRLDIVTLLVENGASLSNIFKNYSALELSQLMLQKDIFAYLSKNSKEFSVLHSTSTSDGNNMENPNLFFNSFNNNHEKKENIFIKSPENK